jgi:hypothetical protein
MSSFYVKSQAIYNIFLHEIVTYHFTLFQDVISFAKDLAIIQPFISRREAAAIPYYYILL